MGIKILLLTLSLAVAASANSPSLSENDLPPLEIVVSPTVENVETEVIEPKKYRPHPSRRFRHFVGAPANPEGKPTPPDQWFVQRLDHFHPTDETTWKQRYWVNEEFYRPGGPAFLMIGGEGKENPIWMIEGTWIQYAKAFGAKCFMLEHR